MGSSKFTLPLVEAIELVSAEIKDRAFEASQHGHGVGQYVASPSFKSSSLVGRMASRFGGGWVLDVFMLGPRHPARIKNGLCAHGLAHAIA
jgi:hypothetical protein